jgi:hypothetical protein
MPKPRRRIPRPYRSSDLDIVVATYRRAITDEQIVLALWPKAKEHKTKNVAALALSPAAEEAIGASVRKNVGASDNHEAEVAAAVADVRAIHGTILAEHAPGLFNYRPSEFIAANLQEAWIPYAELLLKAARQLKGRNVAELVRDLKRLGFADEILAMFRISQKRKYFLQQTPASMARLIVTSRLPYRMRSEETVRTAGKRLYSRIRSKKIA